MDPTETVKNRTYWVIGALAIIGLASLCLRVVIRADYGLADAVLDLGYEGLPAAILFLLIEGAIHQYEQRQERRIQALRALKGERTSPSTSLLLDLAEGDRIQVGTLQGASLENARLKSMTLREGELDQSDLESLELSDCTINEVSLRHTLIRRAVMENCTLTSVQLDDADLTGSLFVECRFDSNTTFYGAQLTDVRFKNCIFTPETLKSMSPSGAKFWSCQGISQDAAALLRSEGATVEP